MDRFVLSDHQWARMERHCSVSRRTRVAAVGTIGCFLEAV